MRILQYTLIFIFLVLIATVSAQERPSGLENCSGTAYGFVHITDETKNIAPVYCFASGFSDGLAAVRNDEKWGFIDTGNNMTIGFEFDGAQRFRRGRAIVRQGNLYGLIDKNGKYAVDPVYQDLSSIEIAGAIYYISRNHSFFSGVIDQHGKEVIPHRFTYIIPMDTYENISFYAAFQEVDTTQHSFFEQFSEDPYRFSPEIGRLDLYDTQFHKLASRHATNYTDGFQYEELIQIDAFLSEHSSLDQTAKISGIENLLSITKRDEREFKPEPPEYLRMEGEVLNQHMDSLGYTAFTDRDGKIGVKKSGTILIPSHYQHLEFANAVATLPSEKDVAYLQENYAAIYLDEEKKLLSFFCVLTFDEPSGEMEIYDLRGNKILPKQHADIPKGSILAGTTPLGFQYITPATNEATPTRALGLINWKGEALLSPNFKQIDVSPKGHILATAENKNKTGEHTEDHVGLFDNKGQSIIPMGTYSTIRPLGQLDNMYLATKHSSKTERDSAQHATNQTYEILNVKGSSYSVTNQFKADQVSIWGIDNTSRMLIYRQTSEE